MERATVDTVLEIVEHIKPHLAGHSPETQGAVLCELLALWLAGHPPELRESLLKFHIKVARKLTKENAATLRTDFARPARLN